MGSAARKRRMPRRGVLSLGGCEPLAANVNALGTNPAPERVAASACETPAWRQDIVNPQKCG